MAIDFKSGFPQMPGQRTVTGELEDAYSKYAQLGATIKAQKEADNMESFEEDVTELFRGGSNLLGSFSEVGGNISWNGTDKIPDKTTAYANYKYLAKKHKIPMDFSMSAKFDPLYQSMIDNFSKSLENKISTLIKGGKSIKDIQKAATDPNFAELLTSLSNEGKANFAAYQATPSTFSSITKSFQDMGMTGTALTGAGFLGSAYAYDKYGRKTLYGEAEKLVKGHRPRGVQDFFGKDLRKMTSKEIGQHVRDLVSKDGKKIVQQMRKKGSPIPVIGKKAWKFNPSKYKNLGFGGWNTKAAQNVYVSLLKNARTIGKAPPIAATTGWLGKGGKFAPSLSGIPRLTRAVGAGFAPEIAEKASEFVFGEDTYASFGARSATALAMAPTMNRTALKKAAQSGFGTYLKKKLGMSAGKKVAAATALSIADGPLPFGEAISVLGGIGWTVYEVYQAYQEWSRIRNQ